MKRITVACACLLAVSACRSHAPASMPEPSARTSASPSTSASTSTATADAGSESAFTAIALPGSKGGIGFDDLGFSKELGKVLVPAGATGNLALVDPESRAVTPIPGFSAASAAYRGGHGEGTTSADTGRGLVFAIDRSSLEVAVADPATHAIVARAKLASGPDYVRFVERTMELWVTEPDDARIEIFALPSGNAPEPKHVAFIAVPGGPESLVIDNARKRAFSHTWNGGSVSIGLDSRHIEANFPNGCTGSRGIALDAERGQLFAGCAEGKAVVLDIDKGGRVLSTANVGAGVDVIAYSTSLRHLYVPSSKTGTLSVFGVSAGGVLSELERVTTAKGAHCVASDDRGGIWVCDPDHGRVLWFKDTHPASG